MVEENKGVNLSVVKAFELLNAFTDDKQIWGVRELAKKTGYNKSTTYRLLNTLETLNILQKNSEDKYILGLKLFELGNLVSIHRSLRNYSTKPLETISNEITETVHFGILSDHKVLYLNKAESPLGLKVSTQIGSYQKAYCTAIGKALLAFLPEKDLQNYIKKTVLESCTSNTITDSKLLLDALKEIREKKYALDMEELELGLICIAIPVFNKLGEVVAAISVSGPSSRFKQERIDDYLAIMRNGSKALEAKLNSYS